MTIKQRGNHPAVNIVRYAPAVALVWREPSLSTVIYHIAFQVVAERIRRSTSITVSEVRLVVVLDCFHALCLLDQHLLARAEPPSGASLPSSHNASVEWSALHPLRTIGVGTKRQISATSRPRSLSW